MTIENYVDPLVVLKAEKEEKMEIYILYIKRTCNKSISNQLKTYNEENKIRLFCNCNCLVYRNGMRFIQVPSDRICHPKLYLLQFVIHIE